MVLQVTIIGLTQIGTSVGLAFSKHPKTLTCVGYDQEPGIAKAAAKRGAITRSYLNLPRALRDARVIVLACPLDEVKQNLSIIADHASAGTVVIDTSPNKTQVSAWAQEILGEGQYFTGWTLALNPEHLHNPEVGIEAAREDLFENSYIGVNDPPGTPAEVLSLSSDLASLLGAKPYFVDSVEADGLIAMGHELPRVTALALLLTTVNTPGWRDVGKLTGQDYAKATMPVLNVAEREDLGLSMRLNRHNLVRLIDDLIRSLMRVRDHLDNEAVEALQGDLEQAVEQRLLWLEQRRLMSWEASEPPQVNRASVLGGWLSSRLKKENNA